MRITSPLIRGGFLNYRASSSLSLLHNCRKENGEGYGDPKVPSIILFRLFLNDDN